MISIRSKLQALSAMILVGLVISTSLAGIVSATNTDRPIDRIRLEQGTTKEFGSGDYVAVNMTKGDSAAWFGVVYGTKDNPQAITIVGAYIRYLGGAEVTDQNGGVMVPAVPIPVLTVFFQQLDALIEFNDTGYINSTGDRVGASNGLFDFAGNHGVDNFSINSVEPVYKILDLKQAWNVSTPKEIIDEANGTKQYTFSLTAENLTYSKIWDDKAGTRNEDGSRTGTTADGVVDKVQFVFHVDASAQQMSASVPWYQVEVGNDNKIVASKQVGSKNYSGVAVDASFKYDHIVDGWDYNSRSDSSRLMLENIVFFGTFIPEIVQKWMDAQFLNGGIQDGAGAIEYQNTSSDASTSILPDQSTRVAKNKVEFKDNWERVGRLEWVSNVTVDGEEKSMYYQVHAGSSVDNDTAWAKSKDGEVKGIVVIGGYIYPAGEDIMHDPVFEASTFDATIVGDVNPVIVMLLIFGVIAVCAISVVTVYMIRQRGKRKDGRFQYQVPPEYKRP